MPPGLAGPGIMTSAPGASSTARRSLDASSTCSLRVEAGDNVRVPHRVVDAPREGIDAKERADVRLEVSGHRGVTSYAPSAPISRGPSPSTGNNESRQRTGGAVAEASQASLHSLQIEEGPPAATLDRNKVRRKRWLHFAAVCWVVFNNGWSNGTTGPMIPKFQEHYHIGYAVVSLIFIFNAIGYLTGAFANVYLTDKIGFGKALVLGSAIQLVAAIMQSPAGPWPLMLIAYMINGFGISISTAQVTGFVGSFNDRPHIFMSCMQAFYGIGAFTSPLIATQLVATRHWSFQFLVTACIAVTNIISLFAVFRLRTQDEVLASVGQEPGERGSADRSKYRQIMGLKQLHILATFALFYVGMEFTLGGWIVTFIIQQRQGGASSGYISSGFFGGLAIGRIGLMYINHLVGPHRVVYLYMVLAIALEITVWAVPSLIENAIAVSVIGLLLGPMYPILASHASRILPRWLLTGSLGWMSAIGQVGSAFLPFVTGVLAAQYGTASLQPLLIAIMVTLIGIWAVIPKEQARMH